MLKRAGIQTAFDIGANVGTYSRLLIAELGCEVHAFEPATAAFERLSTNAPRGLNPHRAAVSNSEGEAILYSSRPASPTASLSQAFGGTETETVVMTTIDTFCANNSINAVDFVKIDTEGYEREVLLGMQETIRRLRPRYLQFEFNIMHLQRGYTVYDLSLLLPDYSFYRLLPNGWLKICTKQFSSNIFMFSNIVAVRRAESSDQGNK
jgi:FkbM family methyltransferase